MSDNNTYSDIINSECDISQRYLLENNTDNCVILPIMETLGMRLRKARRAKNIGQVELADKCGWDSQSRISMYERDQRQPKTDDLINIAAILGVSPMWLLKGGSEGVSENPTDYLVPKINPSPPPKTVHADGTEDFVTEFIEAHIPNFSELPVGTQVKFTSILLKLFSDPAARNMNSDTVLSLIPNK